MALFLSVYVVIALVGYVFTSEKKVVIKTERKKYNFDEIYLAISMIILFLICGLRDISVGIDTATYVQSFEDREYLDSTIYGQSKFEIGYRYFIIFLRLFTSNEHVFILIVSAIIFVGFYIFIRTNCKGNYAIALLIYMAFLYYTSFSSLREAMSIAIAINAFQFMKRRKWVQAVILILIGSSFHYTGLILLIMIPFSLTKWTRRKIVWSIIIAVVGTILFETIIEFILQIFPIYQRYWESTMTESTESGIGLFAIFVAVIVVYSILAAYRRRSKSTDISGESKTTDINDGSKTNYIDSGSRTTDLINEEQLLLSIVGSIFAIMVNLLGRQYGIFSRVQRYFIPFVMTLNFDIYNSIVKNKKLYYIFIAAFMGVYLITIMNANIYKIIPYQFFF